MHDVWILTGVPKYIGAGDRRVNIAVVETREDLEAAKQCLAEEYESLESERFPIETFTAPKKRKRKSQKTLLGMKLLRLFGNS